MKRDGEHEDPPAKRAPTRQERLEKYREEKIEQVRFPRLGPNKVTFLSGNFVHYSQER